MPSNFNGNIHQQPTAKYPLDDNELVITKAAADREQQKFTDALELFERWSKSPFSYTPAFTTLPDLLATVVTALDFYVSQRPGLMRVANAAQLFIETEDAQTTVEELKGSQSMSIPAEFLLLHEAVHNYYQTPTDTVGFGVVKA